MKSGLDGLVHTTRLHRIILEAIPYIIEVQHQHGTWDLVFDGDLSKKVNEINDITVEFSTSDQVLFFPKLQN